MTEILFDGSICKGRTAFDRIAKLQNDIITCLDDQVILDVKSEGRIGLTFVFLLSCLPLMANSHGKHIKLKAEHKIYQLMERIHATNYYSQSDRKKSIDHPCFRLIKNQSDIIKIVTEIGGEAPVIMSDELAEIMVSKMGEMYINAIGHSGAQYIVGGKYFKQSSKYCFSCYDTGIGIVGCVNKYFAEYAKKELEDVYALKWAMKRGNTTNIQPGISGGVGLYTLQSFAKANDGVIRICSGKACYMYNKGEEQYLKLENSFVGTLFEMDIIADNNHKYILK